MTDIIYELYELQDKSYSHAVEVARAIIGEKLIYNAKPYVVVQAEPQHYLMNKDAWRVMLSLAPTNDLQRGGNTRADETQPDQAPTNRI